MGAHGDKAPRLQRCGGSDAREQVSPGRWLRPAVTFNVRLRNLDGLSGDKMQPECKRETTTSRRDLRPAGGVRQGVNARTGSVASAIRVNRPPWARAIVFITIDSEAFRDHAVSSLERDPYRDDGGES